MAVILLPLNDAMVLTFTAPIWAAVLSPFIIKEQPSRRASPPQLRCAPAGPRCMLAGAEEQCGRGRRATFFAILLCMAGVTLISRPSFLGFLNTVERSYLGVFFALFQARPVLPEPALLAAACTAPELSGAAGAVLGDGQDVRAGAAH